MGGVAWVLREISDEPYRVGTSEGDAAGVPDDAAIAADAATAATIDPPTASNDAASDAAAPSELDETEALGEEYVRLDAHVEAMTQRSLAVLAEFDRRRGWKLAGYPSCAHWIVARRRVALHTAREEVRVARALAALPLTSAAMAKGELSFCQVRAITRAASPDDEAEILTLARDSSVQVLERQIRAWAKGTRQSEAERERKIHESRTLSIFPDDSGGYAIRGRLTPEAGALIMRVLEAASDALFRETGSAAQTDEDRHREAGQRRADALELMAERAMAAGFGPPVDDTEVPISGGRSDRYQVVIHVEPGTLAETGTDGRSELEDGTRVTRVTSQRLSCDATEVEVAQGRDSSVVEVGRKTRTIPWRMRRALEIRDRGCRFPGCGRRFAEAHHVKHWAKGGETTLDNCLLLCRHHHRLVHEGGWAIGFGAERRPLFFDPRGHLHYDGKWQPPTIEEEKLAALLPQSGR